MPSILIGVAERVDVIVDFTHTNIGDHIYLQNRLEQLTGRGPTGRIIAPTNIVDFRVVADPPTPDQSRVPTAMIQNPVLPKAVQSRSFDFNNNRGNVWTINDQLFDPNVISFQIKQNTTEAWSLNTRGRDWSHPIHIHLEEFQINKRDRNTPPPEERGRKDVVKIGQGDAIKFGDIDLTMQFRDWLGHYPMHCHNTVHEDHAMMLRWQVVP